MNAAAPVPSRARSGASLVLVLVAVATLVSLALGAAALARDRLVRVDARLVRASLRDEAESALALALRALDADTNAVDHLGEPWARASADAASALDAGRDGVFVFVEDERARLGVPECGRPALAALFARRAGLDAAAAAGAAAAVFEALEALAPSNAPPPSAAPPSAVPGDPSGPQAPQNPHAPAAPRVLFAEEELLALPGAPVEALRAALPFLSVRAGDALNVNTVGHDALVAAARARGASPGGAEGVWTRLEMARGRGDVFETTSQTEALKLLRGEGDVPTADELAALQALSPALRVDSGRFRVRVLARRAGRTSSIECVYDRPAARFLRWVE